MNGTPSRWERLAPLAGLVFAVALAVVFAVSNNSPDTDASTAKWASYYRDHRSRELAVSIVVAVAVVFFVWFAGALRARLRAVEGSPGRLSNTAFGGAILYALGGLLIAAFNFAAADSVKHVTPQVTQTIGILDSDVFFPLAVGSGILLLATGVLIVRTRTLPVWLGWVAVVLGVASVTPIGFFAFLAGLIWIAVVSVLSYLRPEARAIDAGPPPAAPPPPVAPAA
jgi:hypothetical protein